MNQIFKCFSHGTERLSKAAGLSILELLNKLKDSKPRSKVLRIEMILQDIRENRKRVQDALRHVYNVFKDNDTSKERMRVLQHLLKHKLISMEQYDNLITKVDEMNGRYYF